MTMAATDGPVLDRAYLDDMLKWVGCESLMALIEQAPESLREEMAALRRAWSIGDLHGVQEAAHRLKGAAGSVGAVRLAKFANQCQITASLCDPATLEQLERATAEAESALADYRRDAAGG